MLEKMFDVLPDWAKSKIAIRIVYTLSSLTAAHAITFVSQPAIQGILAKIFVDPRLAPGAEEFLKTSVVALLMTAGEFFIQHMHETHVLPAIAPEAQAAAAVATEIKKEEPPK